jgi:hypothetical protein
MSIPLDRLYNFLDSLSDHNLIIYRWAPHGSKKLEDLGLLCDYWATDPVNVAISPQMICHDQEPLNSAYYDANLLLTMFVQRLCKFTGLPESSQKIREVATAHLANWPTKIVNTYNIHDRVLLLHSEQNGPELATYQQLGCIPVYYWSHAIIARDWFRYAEHDPELERKSIRTDFLIYNRAWQGTREYRLKFAELVIQSGLVSNCKMGFAATDGDTDYRNYRFQNSRFQNTTNNIEKYFFSNHADSNSSADYENSDYQSCGIEVVLETLFDDPRWHLTEKTLRPIACGQPFILAATAGSLAYLRNYGFCTFGKYIDESYDQIQDPIKRLQAIVALMKSISTLPMEQKQMLFRNMKEICEHNRKRFFSHAFMQQVLDEYCTNLSTGLNEMQQHCTGIGFRHTMQNAHGFNKLPWPQVMSRGDCANIWLALKRGS